MEKSVTETAETSLEMQYGGFWRRFVAVIIDTIIMMLIIMPIVLAVYGVEYMETTEPVSGPFDFFMNFIFPIFYSILFWLKFAATPGKMVMGLKIVSAKDGSPISTGQAIGRYFAYIPSGLVFLLGYIWVAFDRRKQAWHDKLAGTVVIRSR